MICDSARWAFGHVHGEDPNKNREMTGETDQDMLQPRLLPVLIAHNAVKCHIYNPHANSCGVFFPSRIP